MVVGRAIHAGFAGLQLEPPIGIGEDHAVLFGRQRGDPLGELGLSLGRAFGFGLLSDLTTLGAIRRWLLCRLLTPLAVLARLDVGNFPASLQLVADAADRL